MNWLFYLVSIVISAIVGIIFGVAALTLFMCNAADERRGHGRDIHPDWEIEFKEVNSNDKN